MGLCKTCRHGEKVKGIFFTNYWCNSKNTYYLNNLYSCDRYRSRVNTCGECSHYNRENGFCVQDGNPVSASRGACGCLKK